MTDFIPAIFAECTPAERCVAIVPSDRVSAMTFVATLESNAVLFRVLGHGSSWVMDKNKTRVCVPGVIFIALKEHDIELTKRYAQLCGVTATVIQVQ